MKRLLLASALLLAACTPSVHPTPSPSSSTSAPVVLDVVGYFVADTPVGIRLFSEQHKITPDSTYVTVLKNDKGAAAVDALLQGRMTATDPDYSNLWGQTNLLFFGITNQIVTLDIDTPKLNVGADAELRAIEQLMWTFAENSPAYTNQKFEILVKGEPVESLAGHVDVSKPLTMPDAIDSLSNLQLTSPAEGATAHSPVTFTGEACVFEANVAWKLLNAAGKTVESGSTLSGEACPARAPFSFTLTVAAAGAYEIQVLEYSMKDGSVLAIDSKHFTVS